MLDRRIEPRMLCVDIVDVRWEDQKTGRTRRKTANLDDISRCGRVGYVTGVEFDPGYRWSQENYQPQPKVLERTEMGDRRKGSEVYGDGAN